MTVAHAKESISFAEFNEWGLYFNEFPPIRDMINLCTANVAHTVYVMNRGKGGKKLKLDDFIFKIDDKANMTDEEKNASVFGELLKKDYSKVK